MSNPLDPIMEWYTTARDSMRVTRRAVLRNEEGLFTPRYVFFGLPEEESNRKLDVSLKELENLVVLALVAAFERMLRDHVVNVVQAMSGNDPLRLGICEELEKDVEYWHFSDQLVNAFQRVSADDPGLVKQLIEFRNWVAHGHFLAKAPSTQTDPRMAYERLTGFLKSAQIVTDN